VVGVEHHGVGAEQAELVEIVEDLLDGADAGLGVQVLSGFLLSLPCTADWPG